MRMQITEGFIKIRAQISRYILGPQIKFCISNKVQVMLILLLHESGLYHCSCCSALSNCLWPHRLQYIRLFCPSLWLCSNSCPLSQGCNHLILYHPFLLLPSIFPSIKVFSSESAFCIRWPNCWSFNFSISPSNEHSGLIPFKMDWFDLLAVQETLKSFLQHCSSKVSTLWHCLFYGPTLTFVRGYWKDHSFDYADICQQSDVSAF